MKKYLESKKISWTLILLSAAIALVLWACEGTSSGVDNPQLTVAFRDSSGSLLRVTGDLNIYGKDQNPTTDPEPLWTIKLKSTAFTNLTTEDIDRITVAEANLKIALAKKAATITASSLSFNIQLKTENNKGVFAFDLKYDAEKRAYYRSDEKSINRIEMVPKSLVRYKANLVAPSTVGEVRRVFIPGTPFQAVLVDSAFIFDGLPEGVFSIRYLSGDGSIYPIPDLLNSKTPQTFLPSKTPTSKVPILPIPKVDTTFAIIADSAMDAGVGVPVLLSARLVNIDTSNPGLSILWRQLLPIPNVDTTLNTSLIANPNKRVTNITFRSPGFYKIEVTATLGSFIKRDSVVITVRLPPPLPPPPHPRIINPSAGDSLRSGISFPIQYEMPNKAPIRILFSTNGGMSWMSVVENYSPMDSIPIFNWTPPTVLSLEPNCVLEIQSMIDSLQVGRSTGTFTLFP